MQNMEKSMQNARFDILEKLIDKVLELESEEEYDEAISKVNEVIASLEAFIIAENNMEQKHMLAAIERDRKLLKRILELKKKEKEMESTIDKLDSRINKLEKALEATKKYN